MTTEVTPGAPGEGTPPADDVAKTNGEGTPANEGTKPDGGDKPGGDGQKPAGGLFDGEGTPPSDTPPDDKKEGEGDKPVDPNGPDAYLLAEGILGKGPKPEWFKADKYKSVEEQAKAYVELEKRFGSFTGAPKDGKYEVPPMPEGVNGEFLTDHPVFQSFNEWAAKNNLSQSGYNEVLGLLAQYEQSQVPDIAAIKQTLGENADERINAVVGWARANLSPEQFEVLKATGTTAVAGQVLQLMEAVISKVQATKTPPKVGDDTAAAVSVDPLEAIRKEHAKRDPATGKLLYDIDPKHRAKVEEAYRAYYDKQK